MPIHDWTRVDAGLFHDFPQDCKDRAAAVAECRPGCLPATSLDRTNKPAVQYQTCSPSHGGRNGSGRPAPAANEGGVASPPFRPKAIVVVWKKTHTPSGQRIPIQHPHTARSWGRDQIVSPGNKNSMTGLRKRSSGQSHGT